jgi:membrane protease YdiL (CAAX protease family)
MGNYGVALFDEQDPADAPHDEGEFAPPTPESFVQTALFFYGAMGCVALVWRMWTPGASILYPGAVPDTPISLVPALAAGIAVGLISLGLSELMTQFTELGESLADTLGESLMGIGRAEAILLALASGIAEEMFFRGALQPAVGWFLASLIFGACHFLPRKELALWSLYAVGMGGVLGGLYLNTGHLIAPIAAHVVVNGVNLPRLARRAEERAASGAAPGPGSDDDD